MTAIVVFWSCLALVVYAYAGYPVMVALLARARGRTPAPQDVAPPVSVLVAACNEEARIAARVRDILAQDYPGDCIEVIVASDGSTDGTVHAAQLDDPRVRVLDLQPNGGKAVALNAAAAAARHGVLVFADARQRFAPGALRALVAPMADPRVGGVSGELLIGEGVGNPGLYWKMETRLRSDEARLGWLHGASGAIHAVRRALYVPMPPGTVLDDMWTPLQTLRAGQYTWMARDAVAIDSASATLGEEFRRKLRTLAGNWQLIARLPWLLHPARNPVFLAWVSHKLLRLLVPWALLLALLASALAPPLPYRLLFALQLAAYALAALAWMKPALARQVPLLPAAGTFLMLNSAALLSLPASLAGNSQRLWKKH